MQLKILTAFFILISNDELYITINFYDDIKNSLYWNCISCHSPL